MVRIPEGILANLGVRNTINLQKKTANATIPLHIKNKRVYLNAKWKTHEYRFTFLDAAIYAN